MFTTEAEWLAGQKKARKLARRALRAQGCGGRVGIFDFDDIAGEALAMLAEGQSPKSVVDRLKAMIRHEQDAPEQASQEQPPTDKHARHYKREHSFTDVWGENIPEEFGGVDVDD
jgi:hypothetical protein